MGIGRRIKEARVMLNMTQEDLAKKLGITKGAVANYENETSHPKEPIMYKLIDVLEVDANYLFQDVVNIPHQKNDVTLAEYNHIKKYRELDSHGREMVDFVLDKEYARMTAAKIIYIPSSDASLSPEAAHYGTVQTPEGKSHDDAIMDNDSEWK